MSWAHFGHVPHPRPMDQVSSAHNGRSLNVLVKVLCNEIMGVFIKVSCRLPYKIVENPPQTRPYRSYILSYEKDISRQEKYSTRKTPLRTAKHMSCITVLLNFLRRLMLYFLLSNFGILTGYFCS